MKMCILRGVISSMMKVLSSAGLEGSLNGLLRMKTITSFSLHTGSVQFSTCGKVQSFPVLSSKQSTEGGISSRDLNSALADHGGTTPC